MLSTNDLVSAVFTSVRIKSSNFSASEVADAELSETGPGTTSTRVCSASAAECSASMMYIQQAVKVRVVVHNRHYESGLTYRVSGGRHLHAAADRLGETAHSQSKHTLTLLCSLT